MTSAGGAAVSSAASIASEAAASASSLAVSGGTQAASAAVSEASVVRPLFPLPSFAKTNGFRWADDLCAVGLTGLGQRRLWSFVRRCCCLLVGDRTHIWRPVNLGRSQRLVPWGRRCGCSCWGWYGPLRKGTVSSSFHPSRHLLVFPSLLSDSPLYTSKHGTISCLNEARIDEQG